MSTTAQTAPFPPSVELRSAQAAPIAAWRLVESWIAIIPLLFLTVRGTFSIEGAAGNNQMSGTYGTMMASSVSSPRHNLEIALFYGIIGLLLVPFYRSILSTFLNNKLLLALPLLAIASTAWSQVPSRSLSFALMNLLNTAFAIYLVRRFTPNQQMQLFTTLGVVTLIGSYTLIALFPSIGLDHKENFAHAWQGLFGHKNHCAMMMTYLLIPIFSLRLKTSLQRALRILYVAATLLLVAMTQSRTGWLLLALTFLFLGGMSLLKRFRGRNRLLLTLVTIAVVTTLAVVVYEQYATIAVMLGKDPTLTGRTEIWAAVMVPIMKRPLLGYGYNAFWVGFKGEAATTAMMIGAANLGNAENGVLQIWLDLGAIGVLLMFVLLAQITRMAFAYWRRTTSPQLAWYLTVVFLSVAMLIDGDKFMFPHTLEWTAFVMVYLSLRRDQQTRHLEGQRE